MRVLIFLGLFGLCVRGELDKKSQGVIEAIKPTAAEAAWENIDWETDLWAARERAAKEGKPIYLWEMDGHPLGCT